MIEWKKIKIDSLCNITRGASPRPIHDFLVPTGIPWVKIGDVTDNSSRFINKTREFIKQEGETKSRIVYPGDLILSNSATPGIPKILNIRACVHDGWLIMRDIKIDKLFFYYNLTNERDALLLKGNGSIFTNLKTEILKEHYILLPPLPEQRAIASVLSSLDDKIDLLHCQNATLEKMAETLFRQWFVEEAKEEWEETRLGDVIEVKRGGSPRPIQDYLSDVGYRWLKISDATKENSPFILNIKEHIKEEGLSKTTYLEKGKLVLSNSATPGIPKILQVDSCIHDGWLHFPKSKFSNEFLYLFFKEIRSALENMGNGSIFTNLKTEIVKDYPIKLPDDKTLDNFNRVIKIYFEKQLANQQQIRTLTSLRDTLLPKLMSGEVIVKM